MPVGRSPRRLLVAMFLSITRRLDSNGKPQPIYPTPVVGMVGLVPDIHKVCGQGWQTEGDLIYLLGMLTDESGEAVTLGASEYLKTIHQTVAGQPPKVDIELELAVQSACREGIRRGWIQSAHDCAEGGLAVAIAESSIAGRKGAGVTISQSERMDTALFAEGGARILVSVSPAHQADWEGYCQENLSQCHLIGKVGGGSASLKISIENEADVISLPVSDLATTWSSAIEQKLAQNS